MINAPYEITKTWKKVNIWNTKNVLKNDFKILIIYIYAFSRRFYPKRLTVH